MFRLTFDEYGRGQRDLLLTFGPHRLVADSYYFAIDRDDVAGETNTARVERVLRVTLQQWRSVIEKADRGLTVYLPYDLSDEHTGWLRCAVEDECALQPGWAKVEGYKVWPNNWQKWEAFVPKFEPLADVEPLVMSKEQVFASIDASIDGLGDAAPPPTDPTPLFEHFRGSYATELLTAAVCHFHVFRRLDEFPQTQGELSRTLDLTDRAGHVLITALRAMDLLDVDGDGLLHPTAVAKNHLIPGGRFDISGYLGLAAESPGVTTMVERLRSGKPANSDEPETGTAFVMREGVASAMDQDESARRLTLSLAGRARNVAPALAGRVNLSSSKRLLDVAGGSGLYSIAILRRFPDLRAVVFDREPVLKVAREFAEKYGVADRLECVAGDMFRDPWPDCDAILLSNVLHDWDVPECRELLQKCAEQLPENAPLLIHDVLLSDALDGPLPIALYSAALFTLTEGRAYSRAEYEEWLNEAGFHVVSCQPTLVHCQVLEARRRSPSKSPPATAERGPSQTSTA